MKVKLRGNFFFNNRLYEKTALNDGIVDMPISAKRYLPKGAVILEAGSNEAEAQDALDRQAEARRTLRETESVLQSIDPQRAAVVAGAAAVDEAELRQKVEAETRAKLAEEFKASVAAAVAKALEADAKAREAAALLAKPADESFDADLNDADLTSGDTTPAVVGATDTPAAPAGRRRKVAA